MRSAIRVALALLTLAAALNLALGPRARAAAPVTAGGCGAPRR
jgi:hypothetical protein